MICLFFATSATYINGAMSFNAQRRLKKQERSAALVQHRSYPILDEAHMLKKVMREKPVGQAWLFDHIKVEAEATENAAVIAINRHLKQEAMKAILARDPTRLYQLLKNAETL